MKLLIIEDDPRIGDMLKRGLEEEGYEITLCDNGEEGEYLAKNFKYDLILLDWMLPNKSGIKILRSLRQDEILTPILMLSARGEIEDKVIGFKGGADDYLAKPFSFEELLVRIQALYRRSLGGAQPLLKVGDLTIDLNRHTIKRNEESISLTTKEYELLLLFIKNKNRFISIEEIKEYLWRDIEYIDSNVIQVTVYHLRKKIGKDKIKTQRGLGYCFEI